MKKYFEYTLFVGVLLLFTACTSDKKAEAANAPLQTTEEAPPANKVSPITSLPKEYPDVFKDLSIPMYEGAEIQNVSKHNHATNPKMQVRFSTDATPKEVEDFYIKELSSKGWTVTNSTKKPRENGSHFSVYNNGEKQFLVNSLQHPDKGHTIATMILMDMRKKPQ